MGLYREMFSHHSALTRLLLVLAMLLPVSAIAANVNPRPLANRKPKSHLTEGQHARRRMRHLARSRGVVHPRTVAVVHTRRHRYYERFSASSFAKGDIFAGLWYPVIVATVTLVIGLFFIRESRQHRIDTL